MKIQLLYKHTLGKEERVENSFPQKLHIPKLGAHVFLIWGGE